MEKMDMNFKETVIERLLRYIKRIWIGIVTYLFIDGIAYDVKSLPRNIMDGARNITFIDLVKLYKKSKIILYSSDGNKPTIVSKGLLNFRKVKFIDSNDLTKDQLDKIIDKINGK